MEKALRKFWTEPLRREGRTKKEVLLAAGIRLFHLQGVSGTGVNDILASAGMGKSQFYHYFQDKEDFVCQVLRKEMDFFLTRMDPILSTFSDLERFDDWFSPYVALANLPNNLGCPVGVIASEMSPSHPSVRQVAMECLGQWLEAMARSFEILRRSVAMGEGFDPQRAASFAASLIQGALLVGRTFHSQAPILEAREQLRRYLTTSALAVPPPKPVRPKRSGAARPSPAGIP